MNTQDNLAALRRAYAAWDEHKGGEPARELWRDLFADDVSLASVSEQTAGLEFAADRQSRTGALEYLTGIFQQWEMLHYTPETYVAEGARIAMFGRCAYRFRKTGRVCECRIACLWEFDDAGKAVSLVDIFDSALALAATEP